MKPVEDLDVEFIDVTPRGFVSTASGLLVPESVARPRRSPKVVDLFAGCGGFSCGFHMAGLHVVGAVEQDFSAATTYMVNLARPGVQIHFDTDEREEAFAQHLEKAMFQDERGKKRKGGIAVPAFVAGSGYISHEDGPGCEHFWIADVRTLKGEDMLEALGLDRVDCVIGGPPCQGFSLSGKQDPADPRNNLILEFLRIAGELGARTFIMENVPPLISQEKFRPLWDEFKRRAIEAGFDLTADILNACNYGVPQHRRRAIVVGTAPGLGRFQFPLPTHWAMGATAEREWNMLERPDEEDGQEAEESAVAPAQQDLFGGAP